MSRTKRKPGRPTRAQQTPSVITDLTEALADGCSVEAACHIAGIAPRTFYNWMTRAEDELARLDELAQRARLSPDAEPPRPRPSEEPFVQLLQTVTRARAGAQREMTRVLMKVAKGGYLISRRPALNGDGLPVYDSAGELVYEETYAQPDWRSAAHYLDRTFPRQWGKQAETHRIEIGAPDGAPGAGVPVEDNTGISSLAERLHASLAVRRAEITDGRDSLDDEVTDAEIVEEGAA